jgi:hypothetical protein
MVLNTILLNPLIVAEEARKAKSGAGDIKGQELLGNCQFLSVLKH